MLPLPPDEAPEPDAVLPVLPAPVLPAVPLVLPPVDPLDEPPLDVELPPIELPEPLALSTCPCTWTLWFTSLRKSLS